MVEADFFWPQRVSPPAITGAGLLSAKPSQHQVARMSRPSRPVYNGLDPRAAPTGDAAHKKGRTQ